MIGREQRKNNIEQNKISIQRKRVLSALASYIADLYNPQLPILPERIADIIGISYNYGNYEDYFDGMLEHSNGGFHIYLNVDKAPSNSPRSRFTFAHELGHYFINEHRQALELGLAPSHQSFTNFQSENIVELEADYFASCLLMPEDRFRADCLGKKFSPQLIKELMDRYQVSASAFLLRYTFIENVPVMVICSKGNKIAWKWESDDFEFKYIKSLSRSIPSISATAEFYAKGIEYIDPQNLYAEDWFNYISHEPNTFGIKEYCIYAKRYNMVLTVIWY
ncbi:MAG: hypothetical protein JWO58_2816 [Chitinophagaceae bacterium]|nr:hypothetical protein [Chitinophagaceae bacterium]